MSKKIFFIGSVCLIALVVFAQTGIVPNWSPFGLQFVNAPSAPAARQRLGIVDNPISVVFAEKIDTTHITTNGGQLGLKAGGVPPGLNGKFMTNVPQSVYDVRKYGAIPNDANSDVAAIQDAIDDACKEANPRGGVVYIPEGVWQIKPTITRHPTRTSEGKKSIFNITNNNVAIVGAGSDKTILRIISYANENNFEDYNGIGCGSTASPPIPDIDPSTGQQWKPYGCTNLLFKGFTWDGMSPSFPYHTSICYDTTQLFGEDIVFDDVKFVNIWTDAIDILGVGGYLRVLNCQFTNVAGDSVGVQLQNVVVQGCRFWGGPNNDLIETWMNGNGGIPANYVRQEYLECYGPYYLIKDNLFLDCKDKMIFNTDYGVEHLEFNGNTFIYSNTIPTASPNRYNPTNFVFWNGNVHFYGNTFLAQATPNTHAPWMHMAKWLKPNPPYADELKDPVVTMNNNVFFGRRVINMVDVPPLRFIMDGNKIGNCAPLDGIHFKAADVRGGGGHVWRNNQFYNSSLYFGNKTGADTYGEIIENNVFSVQSDVYQDDQITDGTNFFLCGNSFRAPPGSAVGARMALWPYTRCYHTIINNSFRSETAGVQCKLEYGGSANIIRGNNIEYLSSWSASTECVVENNVIDTLNANVGYRTTDWTGNMVAKNVTGLGAPQPNMPFSGIPTGIFKQLYADATSGPAIVAGAWTKVPLNDAVVEGFSSLFTLGTSVITVGANAAGRWRVVGSVPYYGTRTANVGVRLRRTNNTPTTLLIGTRAYTYSNDVGAEWLTDQVLLDGLITLAAGDTLELQYYAQTADGYLGYSGTAMGGENTIFSQLVLSRF